MGKAEQIINDILVVFVAIYYNNRKLIQDYYISYSQLLEN
jgi:hypothetical protein